jgi:hypothetical protein
LSCGTKSSLAFTWGANERGLAMSKPDRFKEEISWLKALGSALFAGGISLSVWLVQNYDTTSRAALLVTIGGLLAIASGVAATIVRLYRCFKILEAL